MGKILSLTLALAMTLSLVTGAVLADGPQVNAGEEYCFSSSDFGEEGLTGACITGVPETGKVRLGSREIRAGDILTAGQMDNLVYCSAQGQNAQAQVTYLPIYSNSVRAEETITVSVLKKENAAPTAKDGKLETYKNLENKGVLEAEDPEGEQLTFTLVEKPKRGEVVVSADGSFTYTPKRNRVGEDHFTFVAQDPHGAKSNEATITVKIMKPLDSNTYKDVTTGQFEALWMKNKGLYSGFQVAGEECFGPDEQVSRGDFLAMVMELLEVPVDKDMQVSGFADEGEAAQWLRPYLAAAMRLGVASGSQTDGEVVFRPNDPITGAEAAVMLENVLLLPAGEQAETGAPAWAEDAVAAMSQAGVEVSKLSGHLTRLDAAKLLYSASHLAESAPGLEVFRVN